MIVYKDIFTGDEVLSDSFSVKPVEGVPGLIEVESAMVAVGGDVDIGCGNAFGGGGEEEETDSDVVKENNISGSSGFGYMEMPFGSKNEFKTWFKEYVRKLRQELKGAGVPVEDIKGFMDQAPTFFKWLLEKFDDLQFFVSKSMNPDGGIVFSYYKDGALTPTFIYIEKGYKVCKF